jgi:hypothetical protein
MFGPPPPPPLPPSSKCQETGRKFGLHAFTFTSLSAAQCAEIKAKKWDVGEKQGIAVVTSHAGSLANISGVADGDIITAVNNVVWDSQNPKRSFQRLHNELKAGRPTLTLLVIPARR